MSSTRTQIYLTPELRQQVDRIAEARGISLAQVVREALDEYFADRHTDPAAALDSTFGADPGIEVPDRDTWARG
jgi:predicted transcriptional regulator